MNTYVLSYPILDLSDFPEDVSGFLTWAENLDEFFLREVKLVPDEDGCGIIRFKMESRDLPTWYPHEDVERACKWKLQKPRKG